MKSPFNVLYYLKRNAIRRDGSMPIITRVTVDGIIAQFNIKLEIQPNNWSVKIGRVIGHSYDSRKQNAQLNEIKACLHSIYHELQRKDNYGYFFF